MRETFADETTGIMVCVLRTNLFEENIQAWRSVRIIARGVVLRVPYGNAEV